MSTEQADTKKADDDFLASIRIRPETATRVTPGIVDLDKASGVPEDPASEDPAPQRRYTPWVLAVFGVITVVATVATTLGGALGHGDPAPPRHQVAVTPVAAAPASVPTAAAAVTDDHPLPFTAAADCPPGSTTAQSLADPVNPSPWICVRQTEGQPLYITLGSGVERSYIITGVAIVPGDTGPGREPGTDGWLEHRVVTYVQWQFNDTAHTVLPQDTSDAHGEKSQDLPTPITASRVTVMILGTARPTPPADPTPDASENPFALLTPDTPPAESDPSDGTFAVSGIKIIGHEVS